MSSSSSDAADYVIVGGGTSGLVLANRLSENPKVSVLVLEAGENHLDDPRVIIPAFWTSLMGTDLDWKFTSLSQVRVESFRLVAILSANFLAQIARSWRPKYLFAPRKTPRRLKCCKWTNPSRTIKSGYRRVGQFR